ncbi:MAG TPA: hypothetical protein VLA35_11775 [Thermoleophilia bacterium]|nr:hypothetical protein [Thermoleophilia bacterium]
MDLVIALAGVIGLGVAVYGFGSLVWASVERRRPYEALLAVGVAVVAVALLVAFGDRLLR